MVRLAERISVSLIPRLPQLQLYHSASQHSNLQTMRTLGVANGCPDLGLV
jgi:hypothetical protein